MVHLHLPGVGLPRHRNTARSAVAILLFGHASLVVDMNRDGRDDLVVFHHMPTEGITILLSRGNGLFTPSCCVTWHPAYPRPSSLQPWPRSSSASSVVKRLAYA